MSRHLSTILVLAAAALLAHPAMAQTATTTFQVRITIQSSCTIDTPAPTDVDFGTQPSSATNVDAIGQLNVNCTPGTGYTIALDDGQNSGGGGVGARAMANGADLVPYQLYSDAARTTVWGETTGTDTVAGTGTGAVQPYSVYGRVPSANFPAASYLDVVTATITF
ncbi:spore coat U domain-containing protein [Lysobacter sp. TLK-CK17T]|uniref:Spore coat U domain-containing protein n=2 Tax=Marilutibacter chinensis TaxID=2912247 RepID=A0ABS9HUT9_9GAMM|nr:spore coat U domain-containing protein [Lysobacter chinensis]MCF7222651.1 spore coat U domain-containing protein [Lysobacter chinensis]